MKVLSHSITHEEGKPVAATLLTDEGIHLVTGGHPRFTDILTALLRDDSATAVSLYDPGAMLATSLSEVTDRITRSGRVFMLDNEPLPSAYNDVIAEVHRARGSQDVKAVATFIARAMDAPDDSPIRALVPWLGRAGLRVDEDGNVWGYKKVRRDGDGGGGFSSVHSGTARVNGVQQTGNITQKVGDTVTMPRHAVDDNTGNACSTGLHVGSLSYAESFGPGTGPGGGGSLLLVSFPPSAAVAVPSYDRNKLRVCEYTVRAVMQTPEDVLAQSDMEVHGIHVPSEVAMSDDGLDVRRWALQPA